MSRFAVSWPNRLGIGLSRPSTSPIFRRSKRKARSRPRIRREMAAREEASVIGIPRYIFTAPPPSYLYRLPPPHNPHIPMDLLEFLWILRVYGDQNIGIDRLDRILEVAFAGVA